MVYKNSHLIFLFKFLLIKTKKWKASVINNFMSNLLKSKFLLGVMIVAVMFMGVAIIGASKANAEGVCTLSATSTLQVGSTGAAVICLQSKLGIPADGKFGPMTKAAVIAFQTSNPPLVADGKVGAKTRAALMDYQVGKTPEQGTCPTGYVATTPVAPLFAACVAATPAQGNCPTGYVAVTPVAPLFATCALSTGGTTPSGTNGYLTDLNSDSTNRVSKVYESEQGKVVAGFRATARLADQTVNRVRVTFINAGTGSANLGKYISGVSLWNGSTKIATMPVSLADRSTSTDLYTFNFSGLTTLIPKDQIGHFYVTVDANGSIDTLDASGASWTVTFVNAGVSASSPDGSYDTYPSGDIIQTGLQFGKFSSNGVKATIGLASDNVTSNVVTVQNTSATNGVPLLNFTIKATNSDLTLRKVPIQVSSTTAPVGSIINTIYLYQGTNLVDSMSGSQFCDMTGNTIDTTDCTTGLTATTLVGYLFDNLASPYNVITAGSTVEYTVTADLKQVSTNYAEGDTLTASFTNADALNTSLTDFSVLDTNGDQLTTGSTYRIGSAVGNIQTLRINGVNVVMGTPTYVSTSRGGTGTGSADTVDVVYTIPLTVTSFGQTLYAGQTAAAAATAGGTEAVDYGFNLSTAPSTLTSYSAPATHITVGASTLSSSDALIEGSGYRLDAGTPKHFTLTVELNSIGATAGAAKVNARVALNTFQTWTDSGLSVGAAVQTLLPAQSYKTGYVGITAN